MLKTNLHTLFSQNFSRLTLIFTKLIDFLSTQTEALRKNRPSSPRNKAKTKPKFPINYRRFKPIYFAIIT